tara:strand:- start:6953 stop:7246 length:294 start_codon:yes stop_codon:yes gene_type:complete
MGGAQNTGLPKGSSKGTLRLSAINLDTEITQQGSPVTCTKKDMVNLSSVPIIITRKASLVYLSNFFQKDSRNIERENAVFFKYLFLFCCGAIAFDML